VAGTTGTAAAAAVGTAAAAFVRPFPPASDSSPDDESSPPSSSDSMLFPDMTRLWDRQKAVSMYVTSFAGLWVVAELERKRTHTKSNGDPAARMLTPPYCIESLG
jgi:hypothetical protein